MQTTFSSIKNSSLSYQKQLHPVLSPEHIAYSTTSTNSTFKNGTPFPKATNQQKFIQIGYNMLDF
ncbi:unnamed protein product [Photorhabdus laumondii subsp. laumondii TTO1]|uniref:Photorhabdus luminescens subsp. laumondii TTO1 complete genome segment 13/17 n=1 Tax=Photorhabdus laumondii subsp. laumondii (strain DSM 15139 / CIP 105565 / TT01) TaxID=243265 RepID=Q7N186_PHOLL|nr:hypothetical protein [Photorhabdus laumondii]CAE15982.1 unnamed protein product [Photorhabdus laumondii subsp. laumondii TTO1]